MSDRDAGEVIVELCIGVVAAVLGTLATMGTYAVVDKLGSRKKSNRVNRRRSDPCYNRGFPAGQRTRKDGGHNNTFKDTDNQKKCKDEGRKGRPPGSKNKPK